MVGGSASPGTASRLNGTLSSRCTPVMLPATLRMASNLPGAGAAAGSNPGELFAEIRPANDQCGTIGRPLARQANKGGS